MDDEMLFRFIQARTTPAEDQRLAQWQVASATHAERLEDVDGVLRLTAEADDALVFGVAPTGDEIVRRSNTLSEQAATKRWRRRAWRASFLVAAAAASVAVALPLAQRFTQRDTGATSAAGFGPDEFTTEAEPGTVGLRDGTVVRLAPATRLRVRERRDAREVSLRGRGYFAVAHDPTLPFTIHSDAGTVTVLGTRFDLTVTDDDLRLVVIEGRVRLAVRGAEVEVRAGQLAQVLDGNLAPPIDVPDPESFIEWVGNFVVFQDTPLRTVAREIELRHGVRIELSDPALGERTVTALFAGRSFDEIAEVICVVAQLRCTRAGDVLRMAPAR